MKNQREELFQFERRYYFLYDIEVNGVPIYAGLRDGVAKLLMSEESSQSMASFTKEKGRVFPKRLLDSFIKLHRYYNAKTMIFTSAMFRRDKGRNFAAEYLLEHYPEAVVFEWPSRTEAYDSSYFSDINRNRYCPLDWYIVVYKIYMKFHKKECVALEKKCREKVGECFSKYDTAETEEYKKAIEYLLLELPKSYAATIISQRVFQQFFRRYHRVHYAIDFWGSAKENIIPVLSNNPESIELQHGIITAIHPGYIYPQIEPKETKAFFNRTLLVYGEKTKQLLIQKSVFKEEQIKVIGNPRIQMYENGFGSMEKERKLILFASQPYEQDGTGTNFYSNAILYLKEIDRMIKCNPQFQGFRLGVKLHPRENNGVTAIYKNAISDIDVYDNASELYQLLTESFVQITVSSTSLYEAAMFQTPTVCIRYIHDNLSEIFGFEPWIAEKPADITKILNKLCNASEKKQYTQYLKKMSKHYM